MSAGLFGLCVRPFGNERTKVRSAQEPGLVLPAKLQNALRGYTYILECGDGSYYVGSTKYPEARLAQHQAGEGGKWTAKRLPVSLVYLEESDHIGIAFKREHQLKKWSRKKKLALIDGRIGDLEHYAKCQVKTKQLRISVADWNFYEAKYAALLADEDRDC